MSSVRLCRCIFSLARCHRTHRHRRHFRDDIYPLRRAKICLEFCQYAMKIYAANRGCRPLCVHTVCPKWLYRNYGLYDTNREENAIMFSFFYPNLTDDYYSFLIEYVQSRRLYRYDDDTTAYTYGLRTNRRQNCTTT